MKMPTFREAILQLFRDEGIDVLLGTHVLQCQRPFRRPRKSSAPKRERYTNRGGNRHSGGALDVRPTQADIGLEKAGIEVTEKGHIRVNDRLETTAPNVWAMGECAGSPYFTHVSEDDSNIIHRKPERRPPQHDGPAGSVLRLHRSGAGAGWPQRVTGAGKRCCLPGCIRAVRLRLAALDHFGETWVHEDANRRTQ